MPTYTAPVNDIQFVLHDVLDVARQDIPGYAELERDFTAAVLGEAAKISEDVLAPLNTVGDTRSQLYLYLPFSQLSYSCLYIEKYV